MVLNKASSDQLEWVCNFCGDRTEYKHALDPMEAEDWTDEDEEESEDFY